MKKIICLCLLTGVLVLTASPVSAEFDITKGKLNITTGVGLREAYNDNIFLTRTNREDDFITTISPSISFKYSLSSIDLSLDYGLNFTFYSQHSDLNDTSIGETQTLRFQNQIRPFNRVFIDISNVYMRVPIDANRKAAFDNIVVDMTDSNVFSISPYVKYPLSKTLSTRFGYSFTDTWYKSEEANDSNSHSAFLSLEKRFSKKFSTSLNYDYMAQRPEISESYDRHQGSVSATYRINPKFSINGQVGEAYFIYSNTDDIKTSFWNLGTDYTFEITKATTLGVSYGTSFHDSVTSGVYKSRRLDLRLTTGKELQIALNNYYTVDKYFKTGRKDKISGISIDLNKSLSTKISMSLNGLLENQEFLPEGESVVRYSVRNSFSYRLGKRITTSIGYTYNGTNSGTDTLDFHNNIVWLNAHVTF